MISALAMDGQARRYLSKPIMERRSLLHRRTPLFPLGAVNQEIFRQIA